MPITSGAAVDFFGDQDTVSNSSSAVLDGAFSVAADVSTWVNDDDAMSAAIILKATFATTPTSGGSIGLYAALQNIDGTDDQLDPSDAFSHISLGVFPVKDVTSLQTIPTNIPLPNTKTSEEYVFFIKNNAGQTLSLGWELLITPKAISPKA